MGSQLRPHAGTLSEDVQQLDQQEAGRRAIQNQPLSNSRGMLPVINTNLCPRPKWVFDNVPADSRVPHRPALAFVSMVSLVQHCQRGFLGAHLLCTLRRPVDLIKCQGHSQCSFWTDLYVPTISYRQEQYTRLKCIHFELILLNEPKTLPAEANMSGWPADWLPLCRAIQPVFKPTTISSA